MTPNSECGNYFSSDADTQFSEVVDFDDVLKIVGTNGKYQKILLYGILTPFFFTLPLFANSAIFLLYEPPHQCTIPGVYDQNIFDGNTSIFWNNTLPREIGPDGVERYAQCEMFASSETKTRISCIHGHVYDSTDYDSTIISTYNWVCDKSGYATIAFAVQAAASAVGTIAFGWFGDRFGRKPCFLTCAALISVFVTLRLPAAQYFPVFLVCTFLWSSTFPMIYMTVYSIAVELTDADSRAWIYGFTWIVWATGMGSMALIAWLSRHWLVLGLLTSLPGLILLIFYFKYIPESPRWLLKQGRIDSVTKLLVHVTRVNGKSNKVSVENIRLMLNRVTAVQNEKESGDSRRSALALFSSWRLGLCTTLLGITWSLNSMMYYATTLLATSIAGNQFFDFFLLSIVEYPAAYIAGTTTDRLGRRWTQTFFFFVCAISLGVTCYATADSSRSHIVIYSIMVCRFCVSTTNLIVSLQTSEIFPTELRSTGTGFVCSFAYFVTIFAPSIVYLGKVNTILPYSILLVLSILGIVISSFLPETLNQALPETVDDSTALGQNASFWSFLPPDYKNKGN